MSLEFTILGCGSSGGVPRVGQGWGSCDPKNPKNRRLRCSLLVRKAANSGVTVVLIDTSPDLRQQLLAAQAHQLDAVLYTHEHADHTHGIDDLRGIVLAQRRRVDIYADQATLDMLRLRFGYCFVSPPGSDYPPIVEAHGVKPHEVITIEGEGGIVQALPVPVRHGSIGALGFRFGDVLYTPDISVIDETHSSSFEGLDLWIVDSLREKPHPSHFSLEEALSAIERFKPKRAILTNMHNDMDYARLRRKLPKNIEPAYDGLSISL